MKITQATFGVFHHFELGRELYRRGHLQKIYSSFPWQRLKREGLPHSLVDTFPWYHATQHLLGSKNILPPAFKKYLGYKNSVAFDAWICRRMQPCDVLIALSGAGLLAGQKVQQQGGRFICDRGSTHAEYQRDLVHAEYQRWGLEHQIEDPRGIAREVEIYHRADAITVPSTVAKRSFVANGLAEEKIHVLPYGVRLELFHPEGAPATPANVSLEALFVGSVQLRKGIPYLLDAFARLQHPNKKLRIVGHVSNEIKPLLERLPQQHVEFLGARPQTELIPLMSRSHFMVLPSIEEGLALVQGQALACGCPVIATTATGAEDLFTDNVEGFIVPTQDTEALLDRMQRFVDEPTLRNQMSTAALQRVKHLGGWQTYGDHWEALLHRLTNKA